MAAALPVIGVGLTAFGISQQRKGAKQAAAASEEQALKQQRAADIEAIQLEQNAGQAKAVAQRSAIDERRKSDILASRALALAAASGGGATDPTVVRIIADLKGEGAYRSAVSLYRGEEQARKLRMGAKMARITGDVSAAASFAQASAYDTMATTSAIQGGATLFQRYGQDIANFFQPSPVPEMVPGQFSTVNPAYG